VSFNFSDNDPKAKGLPTGKVTVKTPNPNDIAIATMMDTLSHRRKKNSAMAVTPGSRIHNTGALKYASPRW
jgi:hypothetical protein